MSLVNIFNNLKMLNGADLLNLMDSYIRGNINDDLINQVNNIDNTLFVEIFSSKYDFLYR
jgi:hypothetical protein